MFVILFGNFQALNPLELRRLCRRFRKKEYDYIDGYPMDPAIDETGDEVTENDVENQSISASEVSQDVSADQVWFCCCRY